VTSFIALKILGQLVSPMGALVVGLIAWGVLIALRWCRVGRWVLTFSVVQILLFSCYPISSALLGALEDRARAEAAKAPTCCYSAIVVLGGAIGAAVPPQRPLPELFDSSDRVWHAARLFHEGLAPRIIVSGGTYAVETGLLTKAQTEAMAMREFLVALSVPEAAIVMEENSVNTVENMRFTRTLVGVGRVAIVTSAYHMPRAMRRARGAGLNAEAFPTDWQVVSANTPWWEWMMLSASALTDSSIAIKEYLALALDNRT